MTRSALARILVASMALAAAACSDVTAPAPLAPASSPSRSLVPADSSGGPVNTTNDDTCQEGAQRFTSTGVQTCTDGEWRGVGSGAGG